MNFLTVNPAARTNNEPIFLAEPPFILSAFNEAHADAVRPRLVVDDVVLSWFTNAAIKDGWSAATILGHQVILLMMFEDLMLIPSIVS